MTRETSQEPEPPAVLLIGGCPRSGTTALYLLLNSDPRLFISAEENLISVTERLTAILRTRARREEIAGNRNRALSEREAFGLSDLFAYNFSEAHLHAVLAELYRVHHRALHPDQPLLLFGDKFPKYYEHINAFGDLPFPVKYIHITRNPYDVVNSMARRTAKAKQGLDWWRAHTELPDMIETWNRALASILTHQDDANLLHIQYEDLVFEHEATKARIDRFLGFETQVSYPLVRDPAKHFDRSYLDAGARALIRESTDIDRYRAHLKASGEGRASLKHLEARGWRLWG